MRNGNIQKNPWKGLNPYTLADIDRYKFCGRDNEISRLASLIEYNQFVTLYGKSGIGKTSLLQAGVYPELEWQNYSLDVVRLGEFAENQGSFAEILFSHCKCLDSKYEVDGSSESVFSDYFSVERNPSFMDVKSGTRIIVLDQFEEVLTEFSVEKTRSLLQQIANWQDYREPVWVDCHFVVSIREDDLYLLEEQIDSLQLYSIRSARYRLRGVSREGALDIVKNGGLVDDMVAEEILLEVGQNSENVYPPSGLSLFCSQLYKQMLQKKEGMITFDLLKKVGKSSIREYYKDSISTLKDTEIRRLEDYFVTDAGRRNFISKDNFEKWFGEETRKRLTGTEHRILTVSNGKVEIVHDLLAAAVKEMRDERQSELQKMKDVTTSVIMYVSVLLLFGLLFGIIFELWGNVLLGKRVELFIYLVANWLYLLALNVNVVKCVKGLRAMAIGAVATSVAVCFGCGLPDWIHDLFDGLKSVRFDIELMLASIELFLSLVYLGFSSVIDRRK